MKKDVIKLTGMTPGRCHHCGCLMVMVRIGDRMSGGNPLHQMGWRCLICDRVVDLHSMLHRQAQFLFEAPRILQRREAIAYHG